MTTLWIVHRDAGRRAVLARLAGAGEDTILGDPADRLFEASPPASVVLLGLAGDFEAELEFAHRFAPLLPGARWVLVAERADVEDAQRLFDTLDATVLPYPPSAEGLRRLLRGTPRRRGVDALSERRLRDAVASRFARWLSGLELPELRRALDPRLGRAPLLVRGEPGTGRSLLAHYVHVLGPTTGGTLVVVPCDAGTGADDVRALLVDAARRARARSALAVLLEDVDQLSPAVQREIRPWIELAPPLPHSAWLRWLATAGEVDAAPELDPGLAQALAAIPIRLPPLRESAERIVAAAEDVAQAFADATGTRLRRFTPEALDVLRAHPWPGNLRELEAVVTRTLAADAEDPISPASLRFDAEPRIAPPRRREPAPVSEPAPEAPPPETAEDETWRRMQEEEPAVEAVPEPGIDFDLPAPPAEPAPGVPTPPPEPAAEVPAPRAPAPGEGEPGVGEPVRPEAAGRAHGTREPEGESEGLFGRRAPSGPAAPADLVGDSALRRFLGAISHELGNSVVPLRTAAALLPERFADPEFRARFGEIVRTDSQRIESVLERLSRFVAFGPPGRTELDLVQMVLDILEAERPEVESRQLLVLRELDARTGHALGDPLQLRFALEAVLRKTVELAAPRSDLYLASRHHPRGLRGAPALRLLIRFKTAGRVAPGSHDRGTSLSETALDLLLAEAILRAHNGRFVLDHSEGMETLLVLDFPAPQYPEDASR